MEIKSTYQQWKRNKLFTKFSTDSNEISTLQQEFTVNLNNHASTLSKILSQPHSTKLKFKWTWEIIYNHFSTESSDFI